MNDGILVLGSTPAGVQAALDVARTGIHVSVVELNPFLGESAQSSLPTPHLLELFKHPNVTVLTSAELQALSEENETLKADILCQPRYVDITRCTGCGECTTVCPMPLPDAETGEFTGRCAIYGPTPTSEPNVFTIEKVGTAPCREACPIDQRVQGYVALVREGRFADAYRTIKEENPFPSICGRVCNHRCEESCNRAQIDAPVNIMGIKRFVADWANEHPDEIAGVMPQIQAKPRGQRVAVVGAGPAGLTAALDLVRMGYSTTVFEAQPVAGGMMRLGVPEHRLPAAVVQREVDEIVAAGVDLRLNHRVDDMGSLLDEGFDAVFIAIGAHIGVELPLEGVDLPGVHRATDFLRSASLGEPVDVADQRVLVLGGGNVGLDVAQTALRCGAKWVGVSCLEKYGEMPAFDWEVQEAEEEGVQILPSRSFKRLLGADNENGRRVTGVQCMQVDFRGFVDGRPDLDVLPGTEENVPADIVVFAIGQWPDLRGVPDELERYRGRWLVADEETQVTNLPGVTAGGDVVTGTQFIVDAIVAGHRAAHALHTYLETGVPTGWQAINPYQEVAKCSPEEAQAKLNANTSISRDPRIDLARLPAEERKKSFTEMYQGFTEEQAKAEAQRCLVCGACSECLACSRICQAGAIDHYQAPENKVIQAGAIIWTSELPPLESWLEFDRFLVTNDTDVPPNDSVVKQTLRLLARDRLDAPQPPQPAFLKENPRVGIFLCRCGGQIEDILDLPALAASAAELPLVFHSQEIDFACHLEAATIIKNALETHQLDRMVLAACSCCWLDQVCDSCTYQRVRCRSNLLGLPFELERLPAEFINIREQCAWPHRDSPGLATAKAQRLIAGAVAKVTLVDSLLAAPRQVIETQLHSMVADDDSTDMADRALATIWMIPDLNLARVDLARCRACGTCEEVCEKGAIAVTEINDHRAAQVDPGLCQGCGVCAAHCPSNAISAGQATDKQIEAMLSAILAP